MEFHIGINTEKITLDIIDKPVKVPATVMKNDAITTILNWALALSLILSAMFCAQYSFRTRELRSLQRQVVSIQTTRTFLNMLVNDTMEYGKRNPAIDPILESIGIRPAKGAPAAVTKPSSK